MSGGKGYRIWSGFLTVNNVDGVRNDVGVLISARIHSARSDTMVTKESQWLYQAEPCCFSVGMQI